MAPKEPPCASVREFYEQHEHLSRVLAELGGAISGRRGAPSDMAASLTGLREHVEAHIALEESDGYFHEAIAHAPRLKARADRLQQDHPQLALLLDEIVAFAGSGDGSESWWLRLAALFEEFGRRVRGHEQNENQLLQEAYTEDVGAAD
jgi:hypothetical protein